MPNKFLDTLPSPVFKITDAGFEDASGVAGLDFLTIKMSESSPTESVRTISGKFINRGSKGPRWLIDLTYNPMTRAEFDPIYNFLLEKRGSLRPFYISLPQYVAPNDSLFATHVQLSSTSIDTASSVAGVLEIEIDTSGWSSNVYTSTGLPSAGDLFTISDFLDTLHTKAYKITHVETFNFHQVGLQPTTGSIRIHFSPRLQRNTAVNSAIIFDTPLIQVVQTQDIREYDLNVDNLYLFSLKLEEALY